MAGLAHIFRLIRIAAVFAVLLAVSFALPSAAHAVSGHHGGQAAWAAGAQGSDSVVNPSAEHGADHDTLQDYQKASWPHDSGNCCSGVCMSLAVLSLQLQQGFLSQPVRWNVADAQLRAQHQVSFLRPPKF